jgi:hypothetical protein
MTASKRPIDIRSTDTVPIVDLLMTPLAVGGDCHEKATVYQCDPASSVRYMC